MGKTAAAVLQLNYMGCYSDRVEDRDLPHHMPMAANDPAQCGAMCQARDKKLKYAASNTGNNVSVGRRMGDMEGSRLQHASCNAKQHQPRSVAVLAATAYTMSKLDADPMMQTQTAGFAFCWRSRCN